MDRYKVLALVFHDDGFDRYERIVEAPSRDLAIWKVANDLTIDPDDLSVEQIVEKENKAGSNVLCTTCNHSIDKHLASGSNDGPMPCFWHTVNNATCDCLNFTSSS